jgi:hypothetical protein
MPITVEKYPPMPSRPCRFCLSLQGGSVFADFDIDQDGCVFLASISFDGYGFCSLGGFVEPMSPDDSRTLTSFIALGDVDRHEVRAILSAYFRNIKGVVWADALEAHDLLRD